MPLYIQKDSLRKSDLQVKSPKPLPLDLEVVSPHIQYAIKVPIRVKVPINCLNYNFSYITSEFPYLLM